MTNAGRIAVASIAAIPIGIAIELGLEISTSLDRYNATLSQAINAALNSIFMPCGIKDWTVWAALLLIFFAVWDAIGTSRASRPKPESVP